MSNTVSLILSVPGHGAVGSELRVVRMVGREAISELFSFEINIALEPGSDAPDDLVVAQTASLIFKNDDGTSLREIHGMIERVDEILDGDGAQPTYRVHMVPRAYRGTLVTTQQIFMDLSVPDLARAKLKRVGLGDTDVGMNVLKEYPTREFIVQYQEHDIHFISRLTEHLGIAFFFDHSEGRDRIVFSDYNDGLLSNDAAASLTMSARLDDPMRVYKFTRSSRMMPGMAVVYDYNYRVPDQALKGVTKLEDGHGGGVIEYGVHIKNNDEGKALSDVRADEMRNRGNRYEGESSVPHLSAGLLTSVEAASMDAQPIIVLSVEHKAESTQGDGGSTSLSYSNTFTAISSERTFRPERRTPRPSIYGVVTGVVQGTSGSDTEKYAKIDDYGRYEIQFHFDSPLGKLNQRASRPVRMAQPLAGDSEGMHFPLKPGTEVAITCLDGDPDRPIILGAIPNHTKGSVVTASNSVVNKIQTNDGIVIQFGKQT